MSDLHLEMDRGGSGISYDFPIEPRADILALLGDVGTVADPGFFDFLRRVVRDFKTVLFVAGNHEFYRSTHVRRMVLSLLSRSD